MLQRLALYTLLTLVALVGPSISAQDGATPDESALDRAFRQGFELVRQRRYSEARKEFELAHTIVVKQPQRSEWLFTRIRLPDEDPTAPSTPEIRQITAFRHTLGTTQAAKTFLAYTTQLAGDRAAAEKRFSDIYAMRSVMWGRSWRVFIPVLSGLFHTAAPAGDDLNYAGYLYRSGLLLEDAGEPIAVSFFEKAQKISPNDPDITANLGSVYLMQLRAAEAKSLAQLSLSVRPKHPRVLIDLATAEWLLGELAEADRHAKEASVLAPDLPGPYLTMAMVAAARNDAATAAAKAEIAVRLSERHPFYLGVQAIAYELAGKTKEADRNVLEAWNGVNPTRDQLVSWFLRDKPLETLLAIIKRQKAK